MTIDALLATRRFAVLDGGLATELERRGADLHDPLWSARVLLERPALIREAHLAFLRAGADILITSSYQATFQELARRGLGAREAEALFRLSVDLAREACQELLADTEAMAGRQAPLVAASVGPYGAFLHDGSEYRGDYGLTDRELRAFHRDRLAVLAASGADLLALETIPSRREAEVLVDLLESAGGPPAWVSFTARDTTRISDGTPFAECVGVLAGSRRLVAVGINCSPPGIIGPLLESAASVARRPFVVYPNSGEQYDATSMAWSGAAASGWIGRYLEGWVAAGARIIGGCCRTSPEAIAEVRTHLRSS
jgi:homocysteine S-methyltransferase